MIDGHIHYIEYMGADRLNQIVEEYHYDGIGIAMHSGQCGT